MVVTIRTRALRAASAAIAAAALLAGCSNPGPAAPGAAEGPWAPVDRALVDYQAAKGTSHPLGLYVWKAGDPHADVESHTYSTYGFSPGEVLAVASASKFVSAETIFAVMTRHPELTLDSTTGGVLGWTAEAPDDTRPTITLRQLLSFTSGLRPEADCTSTIRTTLAECVAEIRDAGSAHPPGSTFFYGSTHLAVAGRMAEVVTGRSWNALYREYLADPLGIDPESRYWTAPRLGIGDTNPLVAGGLAISTDDYAKVLSLAIHDGSAAAQLVDADLQLAQNVNPYPDAAIPPLGSPARRVLPDAGFTYGLGSWLECDIASGPACATTSSPGLFGFTPWIDRSHGCYAILAMEIPGPGYEFAGPIEQQLQPAIETALGPA